MGPERGLRPEELSEKDKEMMGLQLQTKTEEKDDKEIDDWRKHTWEKEDEKVKDTNSDEKQPTISQSQEDQPVKNKGRFANLELTQPGMTGKELENWEAERQKQAEEDRERAKKKRDEERHEEDWGARSRF